MKFFNRPDSSTKTRSDERVPAPTPAPVVETGSRTDEPPSLSEDELEEIVGGLNLIPQEYR